MKPNTHSVEEIANKEATAIQNVFNLNSEQKEWTERRLLKTLHSYTAERERVVREETEKAFGGCKKCYGKGYATVKDYTVGHEDFGGEDFIQENNPMRFCSCDRGKQLSTLTPNDTSV